MRSEVERSLHFGCCRCRCSCSCFSFCHSRRESASAFAFLVVILTLSVAEGEEPASRSRSKRPFLPLLFFFLIPSGNLLLSLRIPSLDQFPSPQPVISTGAFALFANAQWRDLQFGLCSCRCFCLCLCLCFCFCLCSCLRPKGPSYHSLGQRPRYDDGIYPRAEGPTYSTYRQRTGGRLKSLS